MLQGYALHKTVENEMANSARSRAESLTVKPRKNPNPKFLMLQMENKLVQKKDYSIRKEKRSQIMIFSKLGDLIRFQVPFCTWIGPDPVTASSYKITTHPDNNCCAMIWAFFLGVKWSIIEKYRSKKVPLSVFFYFIYPNKSCWI